MYNIVLNVFSDTILIRVALEIKLSYFQVSNGENYESRKAFKTTNIVSVKRTHFPIVTDPVNR